MFYRYLTLLLFIFFFSLNASAQQRAKIGLVLGGGGAKGSAHIGVLKVLEQHNIPVDYIAGTSIGAYVGGMYALGYSPAQIEHFMLNGNWDEGYSDQIPRDALNLRDKQHRDKYNLPIRLGYAKESLRAPKGLLAGQNMNRLLRSSTNLVKLFESFDDLAIPYRAVATDLASSKAVILDSGSIVDAMQASASVPGAVQPMEINGLALIDGGIANNLPVDVVKAMGADIVIAVDIGSSLVKKDQIGSTIDVLMQLSTMLTQVSTEQQKKNLSAQDILIRPDIIELSTTDWSVLPVALERGTTAALASVAQISKYSISDKAFAAHKKQRLVRSKAWFDNLSQPILAIALNNQSSTHQDLILKTFALKAGQRVTEQEVQQAVKRVYGLDQFERVDTEFKDTEAGRVLVLTTKEKSWGPNYIDVGASYQDDFNTDSVLSLDIAYTLTNLNQLGGQWRNQLSLGYEKGLKTEFYQPLDATQLYYSKASMSYVKQERRLKNPDSVYIDMQKKSYLSELSLGYNFTQHGQIEMGLLAEKGRLRNQDWGQHNISFDQSGAYFTVQYDDLDSINFPTSGNRIIASVFARQEDYQFPVDIPDKQDSLQYQFDWRGALSIDHHAFVGMASFSTIDKAGSFSINVSELGGFLNLSGYGKNTLIGAHKAFAGLIYQYDIGRDMLNLSQYPLYSGISLEAGNVWSLPQQIDFSDLITSGSIYLGTDTGVGPMAIGLGFAEQGETSVFISLGKNWW